MYTSSQCGTASPLSPLTKSTLEKHLPKLPSKRFFQQNKTQKCDVACITDLCSTDNLPEVEIFSLLEEQLPKYKLRADTLTEFGGYENQDWFVPNPALIISPDGLALNKDQIRETLNYFLLCGSRVSQMTRTYDDIEAVTRLLEEKEKDLELTVQIGKELLAQNSRLESRVTELEDEIKLANENIAQLSYEVHTKTTLLAALTNDDDAVDSDTESTILPKPINLDILQKKISQLEVENKTLRDEAVQLVKETDEVEEQERKLMADITNQLNSTTSEYDGLILDLERQKEENKLQHEQIINLSTKLVEAELRLHQLTTDNEEQTSRLSITEENQNLLAAELCEFKARYQEVLSLFQEAQEQLKNQRKRAQPTVRSNLITGFGTDSLQSELMETSLFSDNSLDSGIALDRGVTSSTSPGYLKVFETVRCASRTGNFSDGSSSQIGAMTVCSSEHPRMSACTFPGSAKSYRSGSSLYSNYTYNSLLGGKSSSRESLLSEMEENCSSKRSIGVPGTPGAKDLEAALKRLTPAEVLARRSMLSHAPPGTYNYDEPATGLPYGLRTPDSIMSTGSSYLTTAYPNYWRLPEKLQIVKPMDGSQTLHKWNRLATPTLSGLFDERPGVTTRGGRGLDDLGFQTYSLSDVEEDADENPGKQFQTYSGVYTYTNSVVMHPDDGMSVTASLPQSYMSSRITSINSSRQPSAPSTPRQGLSRRNSCSTFSVNSGLASMLNERGIKAVTPSALNTPAGPNFSPTVTPCNSPEGSPPRAASPEIPLLSGIFSSGADMIRRKLVGDSERPPRILARNKILLSRQEKRALQSLRLVEKVESIGLDNIIHTHHQIGISPLAIQSSPTLTGIRSRTVSPMAQLTSLKHFTQSGKNDELYVVDRQTIRAVLNKGLSCDSLRNLDTDITSDIDDKRNQLSKCVVDDKQNKQINQTKNNNNAVTKNNDAADNVLNNKPSAENIRIKQMQRQKSRRFNNASSGQRPDLGTVSNKSRQENYKSIDSQANSVAANSSTQQTVTQSFVGSISSLFFGRKGGLL